MYVSSGVLKGGNVPFSSSIICYLNALQKYKISNVERMTLLLCSYIINVIL